MSDLLAYEDALVRILDSMDPLAATEDVSLHSCAGRVVAVDLQARMNLPPFANSAMDGFALASSSFLPGKAFPVSQRIAAGDCPKPLEPDTVARIFTGAPIPEGADTVVIQENADWRDDHSVVLGGEVAAGNNIRPAGDDLRQGGLAVDAGAVINSRTKGLLHALGETSVRCYRRMRVALIATGSEIKEPGTPLAHGEIYNSNYPMLATELRALGVELLDFGVIEDSALAIREALEQASQQADFIITIGGMSVGGEDHVRDQVQALGELALWKVAIKPGKPLGFGSIGSARFFGLPGNPVSSFVTFFLFVRPALLKASGAREHLNASIWAKAGFDYRNKGGRKEFVRVALEPATSCGLPVASLYCNQSSGVLSSLYFADALAAVEPRSTVEQGDLIELYCLD